MWCRAEKRSENVIEFLHRYKQIRTIDLKMLFSTMCCQHKPDIRFQVKCLVECAHGKDAVEYCCRRATFYYQK